jgi:hypothetical protein
VIRPNTSSCDVNRDNLQVLAPSSHASLPFVIFSFVYELKVAANTLKAVSRCLGNIECRNNKCDSPVVSLSHYAVDCGQPHPRQRVVGVARRAHATTQNARECDDVQEMQRRIPQCEQLPRSVKESEKHVAVKRRFHQSS